MTIDEAKKLSPDEINRVIAEALELNYVNHPPDYFRDLNACHESFTSLTVGEQYDYGIWLRRSCCRNGAMNAPANIRAIALACVLSERKK